MGPPLPRAVVSLLMGRLDEENKQAYAGRFVHIVKAGESFSMKESWVCFDMNVFKFRHQYTCVFNHVILDRL
jgi:hypothetical protein